MAKRALSDDADYADFVREQEERRTRHDRVIRELTLALEESPAVRGIYYGRAGMTIVSGELSDHDSGAFRATFFDKDGPQGHITRPTMPRVIEDIARDLKPPYEPMYDADVIAWTSEPAFVLGAKVAAFVQADNTLRYRGAQTGRADWAHDLSRKANELGRERIDEAIELLHTAIRELPTKNPAHARGFVCNPPWVTSALADSYEILDDKVPARWLPQLASVSARSSKGIVADLVEFGCGSYGCVLATLDPDTVLKVTSDETESEFAAKLAAELVAPICVDYRMVVRLNRRHDGRVIHLLWRESAQHVGEIDHVLDRGHVVENAIDRQHKAAQLAFAAFASGASSRWLARSYLIEDWLTAVDQMGDQVRELEPLARGLRAVWERQKILFGDIHAGNLGLVRRGEQQVWVITDPGNIAVVQ